MITLYKKNKFYELYDLLLSQPLPNKQLCLLVFLYFLLTRIFHQISLPMLFEISKDLNKFINIGEIPKESIYASGGLISSTLSFLFITLPFLAFESYFVVWFFKAKEKWKHMFQMVISFFVFESLINLVAFATGNIYVVITFNIFVFILAFFVLLARPAKILNTTKLRLILVWFSIQLIIIFFLCIVAFLAGILVSAIKLLFI